MREILLETAKIVGTATESSWSQVHTFFPADIEKQERRGRLLAVLSLRGLKEGLEAVAAGREIIARLHEEYYGNLTGSAFSRLKTAVKKVAAEIGKRAVTNMVRHVRFSCFLIVELEHHFFYP